MQSLPPETVPIALLWGDDDAFGSDPDGEAAREWISGTEVERTLRGEEGVKPMVRLISSILLLEVSL